MYTELFGLYIICKKLNPIINEIVLYSDMQIHAELNGTMKTTSDTVF